jgi:hypothetical protein
MAAYESMQGRRGTPAVGFEGFTERVHVAEPLIPLSLSYRGGGALRQRRRPRT